MNFPILGQLERGVEQTAKQWNCKPEVALMTMVMEGYKHLRSRYLSQIRHQTKLNSYDSEIPAALKLRILEMLPSSTLSQIGKEVGMRVRTVALLRDTLAMDYFEKHGHEESDCAIGKRFGLHREVFARLRHKKSLFREKSEKQQLDIHALAQAVIHDGQTVPEYLNAHHIKLSRERIRQLLEDAGYKNLKAKSAAWFAKRFGHPELAAKEICEELILEHGGLASIAAVTGLSLTNIKKIFKLHGISAPLGYASMVKVTCSWCGVEFTRSQVYVKRNKSGLHFHTKTCQGKWLGSNHGVKIKQQLATK